MIGVGDKVAEQKFFDGFMPGPNSGCWLWLKGGNDRGYGVLYTGGGGRVYAHRFSYALAHGHLPRKMLVCHKCDTPACVNPDHLFLGSQKENMRDCTRKGRSPWLNDFQYARGEECPQATLTEEDVRGILAMRGKATYREIADKFGTTKVNVKAIYAGRTWKHIDREVFGKVSS